MDHFFADAVSGDAELFRVASEPNLAQDQNSAQGAFTKELTQKRSDVLPFYPICAFKALIRAAI
jgi:hypothetical protein